MEGGKRGVGWVTDNADLCLRDHSDFFRAIDTAGGGGDGRWCGASGGGIIIICARELGEVVHPVDCRWAKGNHMRMILDKPWDGTFAPGHENQ